MRKFLIPVILVIAVFFVSCSKNDDGGTSPPPAPKIARVVVDTAAVAPLLTSVDEATWINVGSCLVTIGGSPALYGRDALLGEQEVAVKAIKKSDTLYMLVRWHDYTAHIWADYLRKLSAEVIWEKVLSEGQDDFTIRFYMPDTSADSGSVDVWDWMAAMTAPGRMAEDRWETPTDTTIDPTINYYVYRSNRLMVDDLPEFMHKDDTNYTGPYLFIEDTVYFRPLGPILDWATGFRIPGYLIDSSIFNLPTRNLYSMWDVKAISNFDSLQASSSDYTWTVVFARALSTGHTDDIDLSDLDSVKMSIVADNNKRTSSSFIPDYSGSAPFWMILKP